MKIIRLLGLFICLSGMGQNPIQLTVKDADTQEPLMFCNVIIKGASRGGITNEDGQINLNINSLQDTVVISYLGYKSKSVQATQLKNNNQIFLKSSILSINEVYVIPDNDYLYDILKKCRKTILRNHQKTQAKSYYCLEIQLKNRPLEFLESYYNANLKGNQLEKLKFKNGRFALLPVDSNGFFAINLTNLMSEINMTKNIGRLPYLPLQLKRNKIKKLFKLKIKAIYDNMYHLSFEPRSDKYECFSGELWINKSTFELLKIKYKVENAQKKAIKPISESDSLSNVLFSITNVYKKTKENMVLEYIDFYCRFNYKRASDSVPFSINQIEEPIEIRSTIYCYDYGTSFILPYLDYDENITEIAKIFIIPYHKEFWKENNKIVLSTEQKKTLGIFKQLGAINNYASYSLDQHNGRKFYNSELKKTDYNNGYTKGHMAFWSSKKRIILPLNRSKQVNYKEYSPTIINQTIKRDLFRLEAQILLDITFLQGRLITRSFTVFDADKSAYHLPEYTYTRAFLNIFLDICEIERQKMQAQLDEHFFTKKEIDSIYQKTLKEMNNITEKYISEVNLGKNVSALMHWNTYVLKHLGIDNIALVDATIKAKKHFLKTTP